MKNKKAVRTVESEELSKAAACYAMPALYREHATGARQNPRHWPWPDIDFEPMKGEYAPKKRIAELDKAIELLQEEKQRLGHFAK